jgi:hypothetical protein
MPEDPDEELVRRLLADARHDEPVPADVAARLDGVLADLSAEGTPAPPVVPLRRSGGGRRRRWATALVAAAAVVVGAATLRAVWPDGAGFSGSSDSASESGGRSAADSGSKEAPTDGLTTEVPDLHRATLAADVRRALAGFRAPVAELTSPPAPVPFTCPPADWGVGTAHPVRLDGVNAMLVLRPPAEGRQVADVLACGSGRPLASVTVPAR